MHLQSLRTLLKGCWTMTIFRAHNFDSLYRLVCHLPHCIVLELNLPHHRLILHNHTMTPPPPLVFEKIGPGPPHDFFFLIILIYKAQFSTNSVNNAGVITLLYLHNHSYFTYNTGYLYRKYNYSITYNMSYLHY